jgi:hypothetical protein
MPVISYFLVIIFATLRMTGEKGQAFQALAHFFVAYLFTSAAYNRQLRYSFLGLGVFITLIEVIAFFTLR